MESNKLFLVSTRPNFQLSVLLDSTFKRTSSVTFAITAALKLYFDLCYSLCIVPFRLTWSNSLQSFSLVTFWPQRLICLATYANIVLSHCYFFRHNYPENPKSSQQIFVFFELLFFSIFRLNMFKVFWCNKTHIVDLLNFITSVDFQLLSSRANKAFFAKITQLALLAFQLILVIVGFITGTDLFPWSFRLADLTLDNWLEALVNQTRLTLFLGLPDKANQTVDQTWVVSDYLIIVYGALTFFYRHICFILFEYYLFLLSAVMWCSSCSFANYLKTPQLSSWKKLKHNYNILYNLAAHVNQALSFVALWFTL